MALYLLFVMSVISVIGILALQSMVRPAPTSRVAPEPCPFCGGPRVKFLDMDQDERHTLAQLPGGPLGPGSVLCRTCRTAYPAGTLFGPGRALAVPCTACGGRIDPSAAEADGTFACPSCGCRHRWLYDPETRCRTVVPAPPPTP